MTVAEVETPAVREPLAVVGMGCRFASAPDPETFWQNLLAGLDSVREVPKDRFDIDAYYDARRAVPGRSITRWGSFIDHVHALDLEYFRLSPREASRMDPQQRVLLEVAASALDDACLSQRALAELHTGVFVGACYSDWETATLSRPERIDAHTTTGGTRCTMSGRISYAFNLRGPSMTIDAGCASSLMAIHVACQSLWSGETTLALAGGVNLILEPGWTIAFSHAGTLSADGRCKTFDARADGFVRADGCGMVALMSLARARQLGLPVYALVRGTGVSNDGASNGLLATPSALGQEAALRTAYRSAGLTAHDVQYIEAHGTGTAAGDPVEMAALSAVMRGRAQPCLVGSVKTNIGHAEAAAGVAGFIKTCLALCHRTIPRSLHFHEPNPNIAWDGSLEVADQTCAWPDGTARAGVSSFAISGTDVHVVLEEQPAELVSTSDSQLGPSLLCISSTSEHGVAAQAEAFAQYLAAPDAPAYADVCYSAALGRNHQVQRLAVVARDASEARQRLQAYCRGEAAVGIVRGAAAEPAHGPVFVFSGQGSQWAGMAAQLLEREPEFRAALEACDRALRPHTGQSVLQLIAGRADPQEQPMDVIQPCLFAIQVALAALWRARGVEPNLVVGHSVGEVAAAHVVGILSLEDAARLVCSRSRKLRQTSGAGAMLAVELGFEAAQEACARFVPKGAVCVAVSNSPSSTVLTGDARALQELKAELEQREVFCRVVAVDAAAHSPQLDPLLPGFAQELAGLRPAATSSAPICSSVTADRLEPAAFDVSYWVRNLREPVRFAAAMERLLEQGYSSFVEISPHPVLLGAIGQLLSHTGRSAQLLASLRRDEDEQTCMLGALAELYATGHALDPRHWFRAPRRFVRLPGYAWQREALDCGRAEPSAEPGPAISRGGLLGSGMKSAVHGGTHFFEAALSLQRAPYLADHKVRDLPVLPGAAYVDMASSAALQVFGGAPFELHTLRLLQALPLSAASTRVQLVATSEAGGASFRFFAAQEGAAAWTPLATVGARRLDAAAELGARDLPAVRAALEVYPVDAHLRAARSVGIDYGAAFQGVRSLFTGERSALAQVTLPANVPVDPRSQPVPAALLDACWQALAALPFRAALQESGADALLPVAAERIQQRRALGTEVWVHARLREHADDRSVCGDLSVCDPSGEVLMEISGLELQRLASAGRSSQLESWLYEPRWQLAPRTQGALACSRAGQTWLVFADVREKLASHVAHGLSASGARCVKVFAGDAAACIERDLFTIDPREPAQLAQLLADIGDPLAGVVHLWSLDAAGSSTRAQQLGCLSITWLVQALVAAGAGLPSLTIITQSAQSVHAGELNEPAQAPVWALARVLRYEQSELHTRCIDLSRAPDAAELRALSCELVQPDAEDQIALRGPERHVLRLVRGITAGARTLDKQELPDHAGFHLHTERPGILEHLQLRAAARLAPGPGEVELEVQAAALNFVDVMKAMGQDVGQGTGPLTLGLECAGRIRALGAGVSGFALGQEVVAVVQAGCSGVSRFVRTRAELVQPKPAHLSCEEAVTIPVAFLTADYSLHHAGRMQPGERVLIHSAAGGVGLAAVQLVRAAGAELYATAGSDAKRELLRSLGAEHVFDSRSLTFADEIRRCTGGEGVDLVLNSLAGDALTLSLGLLRSHGRFLEIGKRDIYEDLQLGLSHFKAAQTFCHVDIARMIRERPEHIGALLRDLFERVNRRELEPLPATVFPVSQVADAFRHMAQGKHVGKIVLRFADPEVSAAVVPSEEALFAPDAAYLITGGLGSLGLLTAGFIAERGARKLVLVGRNAPTEAARAAILKLRAAGVDVLVRCCDVAHAEQLASLLAELRGAGLSLRGVFHAAGLLDDGLITSLTAASFSRVMRPKLLGALQLHEQTRGLPLDHFVLYSSVAATLGSPGQANYAAANEFLNALAQRRRAEGLCAQSIAWGPWSEAGLATRSDRAERLGERGLGSLTNAQGLALLGRLLCSGASHAAVFPATDWRTWAQFYPAAARSPMLERLLGQSAGERLARQSELAQLAAAPEAERVGRLQDYLLTQVRRVLKVASEKRLDPQQPLTRLGIDSLMALELKNRIEADLQVVVPVSKILLGPSAHKLALTLLSSLPLHAAETDAVDTAADVAALSDDEVEALLSQMLNEGAAAR